MKTVVVTGASRGIGFATAKKFLANGWIVVGTFNENKIPFMSPRLIRIGLDLSRPSSIQSAAEVIKMKVRNVDVLVNNAGIILDSRRTLVDLAVVRKTFEVNLFGVVDLTSRLTQLMAPGSHIINVGSVYGSFSFPVDDETSMGYRMSKSALNMYTRVLALGLAGKSISVSSIDPGWVKTDMGNATRTASEKPDRDPIQTGKEIYDLATRDIESGCFWRFGKKREW